MSLASSKLLLAPDPGAGRLRRWRELWQRSRARCSYCLLRRALDRSGISAWLDFRVHQVIAIPPWRLRIPPRLPRGLSVRDLGLEDAGVIEGLRPARGEPYALRFQKDHRCVGAFLDGRLVAFLWLRRGPCALPSSFGCAWQITVSVAWLYDLYSDPEVLGAVPHLYLHLRHQQQGQTILQFAGQNDFDNLRSQQAHRSMGYEVRAMLYSWRVGGCTLHLSSSRGAERRIRRRWHRSNALIPLHLLAPSELQTANADPAEPGLRAAGDQATVQLQCRCGRLVSTATPVFTCVCGLALGTRDRGLGFGAPPMPYWGEISESTMQEVLREAERLGWREALQQVVGAHLHEYIGSESRAAFQDVLPLPTGARVLDVGAGWGSLAAPLAARYRVTALEGVEARARFIVLRKQQDGLGNLEVLCGDVHRTPLTPRQFDCIVANGVLEWVALMDRHGDPKAVQLLFLHRLHELLAPGGMIYVGIENRCGVAALRGELDHSGLPYTSLLPRPMARWVCAHSRNYRAHFNVGYRTYTYTFRGYRDLFSQVGLRIAGAWISRAGYNDPTHMVPLNASAIRFQHHRRARTGWRGVASAAAAREAVWRWLGSDFIFLLTSAHAQPAAEIAAPARRPCMS
ncbi:MAG TPA: class I SAM-dependent methyltransferase [Terriglobales bacterium]|nr:class I SAM-dependent methyltransferase [Terriglobales bacterium]